MLSFIHDPDALRLEARSHDGTPSLPGDGGVDTVAGGEFPSRSHPFTIMKSLLFLLIGFAAAATHVRAGLPVQATFTGAKAERVWPLKELDARLPADWTPFDYLVLEFKASSSQRFELGLETAQGRVAKRIGPFAGVWVRAAIPLRYYRQPAGDGADLAATFNQPRNSYWINIHAGGHGPTTNVTGLRLAMELPVGSPTLEIRAISLSATDPGDAILEGNPLIDEFGQYTHADWPGKVSSLDELTKAWAAEATALQAAPTGRCPYGGFSDTSAKATGFFRVEQIDGRWWFVCPDGHLFYSTGVNGVGTGAGTRVEGREAMFAAMPPTNLAPPGRSGRASAGSFYTWNLQRRFGDDWRPQWADFTTRRMAAWGFNTMHNWGVPRQRETEPRIPYAAMLSGWQTGPSTMGLPDVYAADFAQRVDAAAARQLEPLRDDPYMLGFFIGNEPPWPGREGQLCDAILAGQPSEIQARMKTHLAAGDTPARRKEFVFAAFQFYVDTINAAVRKHDPHHLHLGIRFGDTPAPEVIKAARGFDVFSVNIYNTSPSRAKLDQLYALVQRPLLIGEFHIGAPNRGLSAGLVQAANQEERGVAYRYYVEQCAAHPAMVGAHWFQWLDQPATGRNDGENYNIGFVDVTDQPYQELVAAAKLTHDRILGLHRGTTPPVERQAKAQVDAHTRTVKDFDRDWRFSKGDFPAAKSAFDDSAWRALTLPHDWSIEGPIGPANASGTGYAPGGIGWYRKHFHMDPGAAGKVVAVEFDGVYNHAEVWLNGQPVGGRPYGYSSFECDLTPQLKFGAEENVLAVRVDHSQVADSRWYTGSGIYRHVRLRVTDRLHLAQWGTFVTTPKVANNTAEIQIETTLQNDTGAPSTVWLESKILAPDGQVAGSVASLAQVEKGTSRQLIQHLSIQHPQPWSVEKPTRYTLRSRLATGGTWVDETATPFGIRTARFDPNLGFFLNEKPLKLKGVCIHHDAGCLGAAVPEKVLERRLRTLKELGVNAIRTSHNPPAPELLDLCDRLGLLVMDEAFDEFTPAKNKWVTGRNDGQPTHFGYADDFAAWSVRDAQDMVRRDRNHPSVVMWSIGNEIDYANDPFSHPVLGDYRKGNPPASDLVKYARPLVEAVKRLDPTRPVTMALATVAMSDAVGLPELLDVVGYNYQEPRYADDHAEHPQRVIYGSENSHQFAAWAAVKDNAYISGQFLWTGIDFLGEANQWPNRGSAAGLLDLCGFAKPTARFRQSLWSEQPMVYLCASASGMGGGGRGGRSPGVESWNWPTGTTVTVRCYTNCSEVQLSLNDRVIGVQRLTDAVNGVLSWRVPFEPGVLKATGSHGDKICEFAMKTAGPAARIELRPDATRLTADGRDVSQIEFRVVDAQGVLVPDAGNAVTFELTGPAVILGIENGDLNQFEGAREPTHHAHHGRGLAIIQTTPVAGVITLKATAPGLESASVILNSQ